MYENGELLRLQQTATITRDYSNCERSIEDFVQEIFIDFNVGQSDFESIAFYAAFVHDGVCDIRCQYHKKVSEDNYLGWSLSSYYVFKNTRQAHVVIAALNKYCKEM